MKEISTRPNEVGEAVISTSECAPLPDASGGSDPAQVGGMTPPEVYVWRKSERERRIAARLEIPADTRMQHAAAIAAQLDEVIVTVAGRAVSAYWPFRGEPDLRPWMETVAARGGITLLPVVVEKRQPLVFRSWRQGEPLGRGVWNIPIPDQGREMLPDIVIAPLVGFDDKCFRLGYGGGFFDRTLVALEQKPLVIGVGYSSQRIPTIHPQPHDIPMDIIVTENQTIRR